MAKRMNFYLSDQEIEKLKKLSQRTGLAASEIVRRAIDEYFKQAEKERTKGRR